jgi:hypothetical protein
LTTQVAGHCFYGTYDGRRFPDAAVWPGKQPAREQGVRIGMLLDLDQGSMTVYKNDEKLGVMAEGLSGPYCWATSLIDRRSCVRIESAPAPESPTEEELAAAKACTFIRNLSFVCDPWIYSERWLVFTGERRRGLRLQQTATDAQCEAAEAEDAAAAQADGGAAFAGGQPGAY